MYILVINAGVSSLKFKIIYYIKKANKTSIMLHGKICLNKTNRVTVEIVNAKSHSISKHKIHIKGGNAYLNAIKQLYLNDAFNQYSSSIAGVVNLLPYNHEEECDSIITLHETTISRLTKHGGSSFTHQQQQTNILIATYFMKLYPQIKHYACFDNAFHQSIPLLNKILINCKADGITSYGSYGLSYSYIANHLDSLVDSKSAKGYWIILHLGSSYSSICGIKKGKSLVTQNIISEPELVQLFPKIDGDIESLINKKNKLSHLAIELFITSIASSITKYATILGGLQGIIFTGGVGVNIPKIREMILVKLEWLNITINRKSNNKNKLVICHQDSSVKVLVVQTDEERAMMNLLIKHKL